LSYAATFTFSANLGCGHGRRRKFSRRGEVDILHPLQVADDAMQMNVYKTLYAFYSTREMHQVTATASKMRLVRSNASFSLMHVLSVVTVSLHYLPLPQISAFNRRLPDIFRKLNGQNLNKNGQNGYFFKALWTKI